MDQVCMNVHLWINLIAYQASSTSRALLTGVISVRFRKKFLTLHQRLKLAMLRVMLNRN